VHVNKGVGAHVDTILTLSHAQIAAHRGTDNTSRAGSQQEFLNPAGLSLTHYFDEDSLRS
jgi:hypothetical protein